MHGACVFEACDLNGGNWVFVSGLTDQAVALTVTDSRTGGTQDYYNPLGRPFELVRDLVAFGCP